MAIAASELLSADGTCWAQKMRLFDSFSAKPSRTEGVAAVRSYPTPILLPSFVLRLCFPRELVKISYLRFRTPGSAAREGNFQLTACKSAWRSTQVMFLLKSVLQDFGVLEYLACL